nr:immunoglobulin heavy chain junction region [Mus musculus]
DTRSMMVTTLTTGAK